MTPTRDSTPANAAPTRVLFVDDEPRILDGLRRVLHGRCGGAVLAFATGGEAALAEIASRPFDLVVTDLRMPGIGGPELLERVRALAPATIRVVLSGQEEIEVAAQAVAVAHQALSKPCDPAVLAERLGRVAVLRDLVPCPAQREMLGGLRALLARPSSLETLERILVDPAARPSALIPLVLTDVAIAAAVLKLDATRPLGSRAAAPSLEAATAALDLDTLRALARNGALALPVEALAPGIQDRVETLNAAAVRDARRARQTGGPRDRVELAYATALLSGLGELASISGADPGPDTSYDEAPAPPFGAWGAYLLGIWGGPPPIVDRLAGRNTFEAEALDSGSGRSAA
jgi:CheY-like chemotaxis protein